MPDDLHSTIVDFFVARMRDHSNVASVSRVDVDGDYVFEIARVRQEDVVSVWLSDAYIFTEMDLINRPERIGEGDFILIAKPEGGLGLHRSVPNEFKIGIGKIGEFMGALKLRSMWTYVSPQERAEALRAATRAR